MSYTAVNPFNNQKIKEYPYATDSEVDSALNKAQKAFLKWKNTPIQKRADIFKRAAKLARDHATELGKIASQEMGNPVSWTTMEAHDVISSMLDWLADNAKRALTPKRLSVPTTDSDSLITYAPQGIVLSIEPWNVPYYQAIRGFGPAAIAGNVVILKHASIVPKSAQAIVDLLKEAGLPDGVWQNVRLSHSQADRVESDPRVRQITLTGSVGAGSHVASLAGKHLRKTVLELGGADPFIVLDDANLKAAVQGAMARFQIAGQICVSPKRMIIENSLYNKFLKGFKQAAQTLKPGNPLSKQTNLGPLSSQSQADTVKAQIKKAVDHGATATEIGPKVPTTGAFVQPTILTGITKDNPVFHEEIFGPIPMIFKVENDRQAIQLANDTPFGLSSYVYSTNTTRAVRVANQLDAGMSSINAPLSNLYPGQPFGGTKNSGFGREMGIEGIREFTNIKPIALPQGDHGDYSKELSKPREMQSEA